MNTIRNFPTRRARRQARVVLAEPVRQRGERARPRGDYGTRDPGGHGGRLVGSSLPGVRDGGHLERGEQGYEGTLAGDPDSRRRARQWWVLCSNVACSLFESKYDSRRGGEEDEQYVSKMLVAMRPNEA